MAVGDAHRADVIALGKQKFQNAAPVAGEPLRVDRNFHAFRHQRYAGRKQARDSLDLHQAQPARAGRAQAVQGAQRGNEDVVFARYLEDGLIFACTDCAAIDRQSFDPDWRSGHAVTSLAACRQTPAEHPGP